HTRARSVVGDHAADGAHIAAGRIGSETPAHRLQPGIQVAVDDAGLHAHVLVADLDDAAKVAAHVDDDAVAKALARHAGARAARDQRDRLLRRVTHQPLHVLLVARYDHAERPDLKNARIRAVHRPRQIVEQNLALDEPA